jgi:hypothetical protein
MIQEKGEKGSDSGCGEGGGGRERREGQVWESSKKGLGNKGLILQTD